MPGPAPKPTALKKLAGNPGKRPLNSNEPTYPVEIPPCPRHLSKVARREWRRVTKLLLAAGVIAQVDRAVLAAYCVAYGRWVEAEEQLTEVDDLKQLTPGGMEAQSVYLQIANKAMLLMYKFAAEFGFTPSARTRVHVQQQEREQTLSEELFQQAGVEVTQRG